MKDFQDFREFNKYIYIQNILYSFQSLLLLVMLKKQM